MTFPTKEAALAHFEKRDAFWLVRARRVARRLGRETGYSTVDEVRKECPPPEHRDPRLMGAIHNTSDWKAETNVNSKRDTCHHRQIRRFRYIGK